MLKKLIAKITGRNRRQMSSQEAVSKGQNKPLPPSTDKLAMVEKSAEKKIFKCGHVGPKWFILDTYGTCTKRIESQESCPRCLLERLERYAIRCAVCGHIIVPGDGVALYCDTKRNRMEHIQTAQHVDKRTVLGCMRWGCCPSGGFFGGNWLEEGFVPRFGGGTAASEAFMTSQIVVVEDILS